MEEEGDWEQPHRIIKRPIRTTCCCCNLDTGIAFLVIILFLILPFEVFALVGNLFDDSSTLRAIRILRIIPGTALDILIRTIMLLVMYCCYRDSYKVRKATYIVWIVCLVLLFLSNLFFELIYNTIIGEQKYTEDIDARIAASEAKGEQAAAYELIEEKTGVLESYKLAKIMVTAELVYVTFLDAWIAFKLYAYAN